MQSQYQYGNEDWINCTTNIMDSSKASMYLEVCYNGSTFLPITNVTSSLEVDAVSDWVNCSLQRMEGYHFHFNSKANVSMRCRVDDHYFNTSLTSRCVLPNISVPLGKHIYFFFIYYFFPISLMLYLYLSLLIKTVRLFWRWNHSLFVFLIVWIFFVYSSCRNRTENSRRLAWILSRNILPCQCKSIQMEGYVLRFQKYNLDPKTDLLDA